MGIVVSQPLESQGCLTMSVRPRLSCQSQQPGHTPWQSQQAVIVPDSGLVSSIGLFGVREMFANVIMMALVTPYK